MQCEGVIFPSFLVKLYYSLSNTTAMVMLDPRLFAFNGCNAVVLTWASRRYVCIAVCLLANLLLGSMQCEGVISRSFVVKLYYNGDARSMRWCHVGSGQTGGTFVLLCAFEIFIRVRCSVRS